MTHAIALHRQSDRVFGKRAKTRASTLPPGGSGSPAPRNVRALAHSFLLRCETDERYVNIALDRTLRELRFDSRDRDFFTALVYGVTERRITLDYYISLLSKKPLARLDPTVLTALRMGLYQIIYMDGVPDSAACNESVKLVRRGASSAAPFVNAVLRSFIRRRDELRLPDRVPTRTAGSRSDTRFPQSLRHFGASSTAKSRQSAACAEWTSLRRRHCVQTLFGSIEMHC